MVHLHIIINLNFASDFKHLISKKNLPYFKALLKKKKTNGLLHLKKNKLKKKKPPWNKSTPTK